MLSKISYLRGNLVGMLRVTVKVGMKSGSAEIDISHYILKTLSIFGLVWTLREPPARVYAAAGKLE